MQNKNKKCVICAGLAVYEVVEEEPYGETNILVSKGTDFCVCQDGRIKRDEFYRPEDVGQDSGEIELENDMQTQLRIGG